MTEKPVRYLEWVRVSSRGQIDRDTDEVQRQILQRMRETYPGTLVARIDPGFAISGALDTALRWDYQELAKHCAARDFDELRMVRIDRATRHENPHERTAIAGLLFDAGAKIRTADGQVFDLSTSMGQLAYSFLTGGSAIERQAFAGRTRDAKAEHVQHGRLVEGIAPYGLIYTKPSTRGGAPEWRKDPVLAEPYREAGMMVLREDKTCREIARWGQGKIHSAPGWEAD